MKRFFRIIYYSGIIILFLIVALVGFTQTKTFRGYLRTLILETASQELTGTVTFGGIQGNLLTGLQVDSIAVHQEGHEILRVKRAEVRYDPFGFLFNHFSLTRVRLIEPSIALLRSLDGTWNIERLIKSSPTDTVSSAWVYDLKNVEIENGTVVLKDSLSPSVRHGSLGDAIDYSNVTITSLNLSAGVRVTSTTYSLDLRRLAFQTQKPEFSLLQLSGRFLLTPTEATVTRMAIRTAGSSIRLNARLQNIDLLHVSRLEDFKEAPVTLELDAQRVDFYELRQFISPGIDFLERDASIKLTARGTFAKLSIDDCTIGTPKSKLKATGSLSNLHKPEELYLSIAIPKSHIDPDDILLRLAGLNLPDLRFLDGFDVALHFEGRPDLFTIKAEGEFAAGNLAITGNLNNQHSPLTYEATITTANLNVGALVNDKDLESALNVRSTITGSGTTLADATALMRMEIDTSQFIGKQIRPSIIIADLANRTLRSRISLQTIPMRVDASTEMKFYDDSTAILLQGRVNSFDLVDLFKKKRHESDITFDFKLTSNGFHIERSRTTAEVKFLRSTFAMHEFDGGTLSLAADFEDPNSKRLHLTSSVADLDVEGSFSIDAFVQNIQYAVEVTEQAIRHRIESLDTLRGFGFKTRATQPRPFVAQIPYHLKQVDARFTLKIHDFEPIGIFTGVGLAGVVQSKGTLTGDLNDLHFAAESSVEWFQYRDDNVLVTAFDGTMRHELNHLKRVHTLDSVQLDLDLQLKRLSIDETALSDIQIQVVGEPERNLFNVSMLIDSLVNVEARGSTVFARGSYAMTIPAVKVSLQSFNYENADTVQIVLGRDGYRIDQLNLRREVEEFQVQGYFNPFGVSDVEVRVRNMLLNDFQQFSRDPDVVAQFRDLGGIVNGRLLFRGSFDHPNMVLEATIDGLRTKETVLGALKAQFSYFEKVLKVNAELRSKAEEPGVAPDLVLAGTLPYDLTLSGMRGKNIPGEIDIAVRSKGVRLELIDPFIDVVSSMTGLLICDVRIRGTTQDPLYEGFVSVQNARFLFVPLNIQYTLDGRFVPSGRRVGFENVTIKNVETDRTDGSVNLTGTFALQGISLKEFDLLAKGQLLVMKESARRADQTLFGNLVVATSPSGLRWRGSPDRSNVTGEVYVRNASLTFPPTRASFIVPNRAVSVTFVNDTLTADNPDSQPATLLASVVSPRGSGLNNSRTPSVRTNGGSNSDDRATESRSFLDNIVYDLSIETQGITQVRFVFNPLTNEELFADLRGRLAFAKINDQTRLTGEVEVTNRSYYNFIQKFEATGKLLFTGDAINPELDVVARYEGVYRPDTTALLRASQSETPKEQRVVVILEISGSRSEPKVKIGLEREQDGRLVRVTEGDQESDAIAFLISGTFRDELSQQQRSALLGGNILMGLTSSVLSGPLSEFLRREFGVIRSVDVLFYGGGFDQTPDIRVTGEVGDAVIRFGGRVFSDRLGPNVNIQLPMSSVLNSDRWRNLILELERRDELVETFDERRKSNSARLVYRINF